MTQIRLKVIYGKIDHQIKIPCLYLLSEVEVVSESEFLQEVQVFQNGSHSVQLTVGVIY